MKKKKELGRVKILIEVKVLGEEDVLGRNICKIIKPI